MQLLRKPVELSLNLSMLPFVIPGWQPGQLYKSSYACQKYGIIRPTRTDVIFFNLKSQIGHFKIFFAFKPVIFPFHIKAITPVVYDGGN